MKIQKTNKITLKFIDNSTLCYVAGLKAPFKHYVFMFIKNQSLLRSCYFCCYNSQGKDVLMHAGWSLYFSYIKPLISKNDPLLHIYNEGEIIHCLFKTKSSSYYRFVIFHDPRSYDGKATIDLCFDINDFSLKKSA